ncbi:MAG: glycosyltransferase [Proteobacteria bacterium]|nr:glycosyltransferase [Pseudomonadota bacterium]MBU4132223.1 glycosyltransferase [Pseudomonadota bacterium]
MTNLQHTSSKVSVIIPTFNEEKYLPLCLESISNLSWPEDRLEVIVVDNGSQDKTCEIAAAFNARVLTDKTKNVSGLRNLGAKYASGQILAFLDADCIVSPDWLMAAEKYFYDEKIVAWGSPPQIDSDATWVQKAWYLIREKSSLPETVPWLESMNFFVRKEKFTHLNGFDESLVTCEDVDFSYRISSHGLIMADQAISAVHLGEADTVLAFAKKELWRGVGNFHGLFRHGIHLKELPSLGIPLYFGLFLPLLFALVAISMNATLGMAGLLAFLVPGGWVLFKVRNKKAGFLRKAQLFFLVYLYFFVRTLAVLPFKISRWQK